MYASSWLSGVHHPRDDPQGKHPEKYLEQYRVLEKVYRWSSKEGGGMRTQRSGRGLHNVPAELTSFVGRRRELAEIKRRLGSSRLVTLTGPGGVGKTRLALRAAAEVARAFPDGVWLVPLASIQDPLLIAEAAFNALGVQNLSAGWSLTTLADYLVERHLLLIFDNCEHLLDGSAVLASTLLKSCPELRLLATSRE